MALVLIKEDGTGLVNANTYAGVADGDGYHEAHLYGTAWTGALTADKERALAMATRLIDQEFQFYGFKVKREQALQWPRVRCPDVDLAASTVLLGGLVYETPMVASDQVPVRVIQATCEMARELLIADRTSGPVGEGIAMQRNADLSEVSYDKKDRRPVLPYPVQTLLCKYGTLLRGGAMVRVVRG